MARFLILNFRVGGYSLAACGLATLFGGAFLRAETPKVPAQQPAATAKPSAPVKPPAMAPAANPALVPPPDTLGRYGDILAPGDDMTHPLKLHMPFPDVGEIRLPSPQQLVVRDKLEELATFSDGDIRKQLEKWPAYGKMNLRDEGAMLQRIQDFRDYRTRVALQKAHDMGLLTLTADQKLRFEKDYWTKRLQMERDLAKQFQPIQAAREQKLQDELFREFSSAPAGPIVPAPKPPAPMPPPGSAVAQGKPVAPAKPSAPSTPMAVQH